MAARIRTIKPEAFTDEKLWDAEHGTGLPLFRAYTGLWCQADKEGRFEWRPRPLKLDVLPYWDGDFERVLDALVTCGFLVRYTSNGREYGCIPNFKKHQFINGREPRSVIPEPPTNPINPIPLEHVNDVTPSRASREADAPIPSPTLPIPFPIPDAGACDESEPTPEPVGKFRMHAAWRPSESSVASARVQLVEDYAIPVFVGQFVGHFAETDERRTNPEWNQRWQKWVTRGWNDSAKRPKRPVIDDATKSAEADAAAKADRLRREARGRAAVAAADARAKAEAEEALRAAQVPATGNRQTLTSFAKGFSA